MVKLHGFTDQGRVLPLFDVYVHLFFNVFFSMFCTLTVCSILLYDSIANAVYVLFNLKGVFLPSLLVLLSRHAHGQSE